MENSIEVIWKEGFLNEKSLVAPKVNDLYNRKSKHLIDEIKRRFDLTLRIIVITAIVFPVIYFFLGFIWQGAFASILLFLTAWYNKRLLRGIKTLNQGSTSLDYLKEFDAWLEDILGRSMKVVRFSYPLYLLVGLSTVWSAWSQQGLTLKIYQKFPDSIAVGNIPGIAVALVASATLLMFIFSGRIYRCEVRFMYGAVLDKLKKTISEMEKLKQE